MTDEVIVGDGKYPFVLLEAIQLPERPEDGNEHSVLFFNPRSLESFTLDDMNSLREAIRLVGLQQPPIVRVFTKNKKKTGEIEKVELIAGERRFRSISSLYEDNVECYDEFNDKHVSAQELYKYIPCKVLYNVDDATALKIAFQENDGHNPLTVADEIALVRRLINAGMKQDQIATLLSKQISWVSQTANFSEGLPKPALEKLLKGEMTRHVAIQILSYAPEDRDVLYNNALDSQKAEIAEAISALEEEVVLADDEIEIAKVEHKMAEEIGNSFVAKKAAKKLTAAKKRLVKASETKRNLENDSSLRSSHIFSGGQKAGVAAKTAKMLTKPQIDKLWIQELTEGIERCKVDALTDQEYPPELLRLVKKSMEAILASNTDPYSVIREYLFEEEIWEEPLLV